MRKSKATVTSVMGELMLTIGVILLLFAFYEAYWTNLESGKLQDQASQKLDEDWKGYVNPRGKQNLELGEAFARMYIPTFGSDFQFAIVEGTEDADLLMGPGHYVDTQMPGEKGNFAVAGHRVGKGAPFNDLGNLQTCDAIVVETRTQWVTYRVLPIDGGTEGAQDCLSPEQQAKLTGEYAGIQGRMITNPGNGAVVAPIPNTEVPAAQTSEGLMTLTTCHPQFSNAERMIIHAMQVSAEPKTDGHRPAALEER